IAQAIFPLERVRTPGVLTRARSFASLSFQASNASENTCIDNADGEVREKRAGRNIPTLNVETFHPATASNAAGAGCRSRELTGRHAVAPISLLSGLLPAPPGPAAPRFGPPLRFARI